MSKHKAEEILGKFAEVSHEMGYYSRSKSPWAKRQYRNLEGKRDHLHNQLIAALCASPNAALLEACKRLYDICSRLTVGQVIELGDDAAIAAGLYDAWKSCRYEPSWPLDLDWAKEAIAKVEEANRCQLAESGK